MKNETTETVTISRGEEIVNMRLKRTSKGLTVIVKTIHKALEEMFAEWSNGERVPTNSQGRKWIFSTPQSAYALGGFANLAGNRKCKGGSYRMDNLGTDIFAIDGRDAVVNLSFLRLVGLSKEPVTFTVRGVYSQEAMDTMQKMFSDAILQLYLDFIKPIDVVICITSSQESRE